MSVRYRGYPHVVIVAWLVVGTALALCVAGWVPTLRGAVRGAPRVPGDTPGSVAAEHAAGRRMAERTAARTDVPEAARV